MQDHEITKVFSTNLKKDGSPILNKWGKPTWRVGIKTTSYGDKWINGFTPFDPKNWEGTKQKLNIEEYFDEYSKTNKMKFELPRKETGMSEKDRETMNEILTSVQFLVTEMRDLRRELQKQDEPKDDYPEAIDPADIPFG